jgi:hypothetical protein
MRNFCNGDYFLLGFAVLILITLIFSVIYIIKYIIKNIVKFVKNNEKMESIKNIVKETTQYLIAIVFIVLVGVIGYFILYGIGWLVSMILCA